jgi:hypothetical protein
MPPHAETAGPLILGAGGGLQDRLHFHQLGGLDPAVGLDALAAIAAILDASAGLDREQRGSCTSLGAWFSVNLRRAKDQLGKGQVEQGGNFLAGPVITQVGVTQVGSGAVIQSFSIRRGAGHIGQWPAHNGGCPALPSPPSSADMVADTPSAQGSTHQAMKGPSRW